MDKKRVTVFWMHETERAGILPLLESQQGVTEKFAVGEMDDQEIAQAEALGAVVQEQRPTPSRAQPSHAPPQHDSFGFLAPLRLLGVADFGIPDQVDYYALDLDRPLLPEVRTALEQAGATI